MVKLLEICFTGEEKKLKTMQKKTHNCYNHQKDQGKKIEKRNHFNGTVILAISYSIIIFDC